MVSVRLSAISYAMLKGKRRILSFANSFLNERISSLQKDVLTCIVNTCPFPAILYCFATIDLLAALYIGTGTSKAAIRGGRTVGITEFSMQYMQQMMGYAKFDIELLQDIFRHKTVHLAQPKLVLERSRPKRKIGWMLYNYSSTKHLTLDPLGKENEVKTIVTPEPMYYNHIFSVSVQSLMEDIRDSVYRSQTGYLALLERSKARRERFARSVDQIFSMKT